MIVVAILGIIATIAIPSYFGYISSAKKSEAKTNIQSLKLLLEQYYAENSRYCPETNCSGITYTYTEDNSGNPTCSANCITDYLPGFTPKSAAGSNAVLYDYTISLTSNTAFTITASPVSGRGAPSGNLCINQDGDKNLTGCISW